MAEIQKRVLLADGDSEHLVELAGFLTEWGFAVTMAANGAEGLKAFKTKKAQLVITSIFMPVVDGLEMIKGIRRIDVNVPIIVNRSPVKGSLSSEVLQDDYKVNVVINRPVNWFEYEMIIKDLIVERERLDRIEESHENCDESKDEVVEKVKPLI